jgi:hypothetical protein
MDGGAT